MPKKKNTKKKKAADNKQDFDKPRKLNLNSSEREAEDEARLLRHRNFVNDLVGLVCILVAVVLFVLAAVPTGAALGEQVSHALNAFLGIGAYILPVALLIFGLSFFFKRDLPISGWRLGLGLLLVFLSCLGLADTASTAAASGVPTAMQSSVHLGGLLGQGFRAIFYCTLGDPAATIILVGLVVIGLVIAGLSISALVQRARAGRRERRLERGLDEHLSPYAKGRRIADQTPAETTKAIRPAETTKVLHDAAGPQTLVLDDPEKTALLKPRRPAKKAVEDAHQDSMGTAPAKTPTAQAAAEQAQPVLPEFKLLEVSRDLVQSKAGARELQETAALLQATLEEFGVDGKVLDWVSGPTVTMYELELGEGVRLTRLRALQDDIQLALAAQAIRIVAPIPHTSLVGIEVPNKQRQTVLLGDVLRPAQKGVIDLAIGKNVEGQGIIADLTRMPHLLIGGTTGSGKSVAINAFIMSVLMHNPPAKVRMILIDPKRVELSFYNDIPHLYVPVVTDPAQAASALSWTVLEMERRLKVFEQVGAKNIAAFNDKVEDNLTKLAQTAAAAQSDQAMEAAKLGETLSVDPERDLADRDGQNAKTQELSSGASVAGVSDAEADLSDPEKQERLLLKMPYIVVVIDELADLMMVAGKDVELSISRIAQLARAAGIHLIVATQRPTTNIITGLIKANIVNRIAFTVASGTDSRVILDSTGAEDLVNMGDMLYARPEVSKPERIQGCFVSEKEINRVVKFWRSQGAPEYHNEILANVGCLGANTSGAAGGAQVTSEDEPLMWQAAEIVVSTGLGSTSTLQRRLKVGYARAGRIMDMLELKGIVGPPNGSKPREVLVDDVLDLESLKAMDENGLL
ncbi:MAG: DNA translocase FtsK 4TM domain-containing protein [Coriobacteriales bacterium]|jgi:S-DNA-T family DNA segregation ATPase FtsK/SpoIIIE|nr:DNA translocase FtsK 4TM domain-containing protein [Coriobacteriales bacterium]